MNGTPAEKKYGQHEVDDMIIKIKCDHQAELKAITYRHQELSAKCKELQENYDKLKDLHVFEIETKNGLIDYIKGLEQGVKLCHNG